MLAQTENNIITTYCQHISPSAKTDPRIHSGNHECGEESGAKL